MNQGSLLDVLKKHKNLTAAQLLKMSIEASTALLYLEKEKIVHRDVAARNFLVSKSGEGGDYTVKLGDFGMSRATAGEIYSKKSGTFPIRWCAPEVLDDGTYSSKSDVWAFGISLWEIFSGGKVPYGWMSNQEVYTDVPKGTRLPKPETCPDDVYLLMLDCWKLSPQDRPSFSNVTKRLRIVEEELFGLQKSSDRPSIDIDEKRYVKTGKNIEDSSSRPNEEIELDN